MNLRKCKVCGCTPYGYNSSVMALGGTFRAYCIECTFDEGNQEALPFVEHTFCVYGNNEKEAAERWNELNK